MTGAALSFAGLGALLADLSPPDAKSAAACAASEARLVKPSGALGRLEGLTQWLAAWQGRAMPRLDTVRVVVFAGNHGVAAQGVSAYPSSVTAQMVQTFEAGGAAINQLCRQAGAELAVVPLALDRPTRDFTYAPAMSEDECAAAFAIGMEAVGPRPDLLAVGEMGIGNTASAAALALALFGGAAEDWVGPGTGVSGPKLAHKARVVAAGVAAQAPGDPLQALARLGGREIAALAGSIVAARRARVPVLLDGYVVAAAAAVLAQAAPGALDHCQAAHVSGEPGHRRLLAKLGMTPLLDLGLRLGEASGAALAIPLLRSALACHSGMARFDEAGVAEKTD